MNLDRPWLETLRRERRIAALDRLRDKIASLSSGDRFIAWTLALLIVGVSIAGFLALERSLFVSVPAYGGTLTEGEVGSPRFINPLLAISDADRDLATLTYAGLMGLDAEGGLIPVIAESYTVSNDGKTYTFTLRPDVVFSDGSSITANDVVFTVQKAQDPNLKSPRFADFTGVAVSAPDARTVVFKLAKPYAPFLENATLGILPARLWSSISDEEFPFSDLETNPVGAGPFKVDGMTRDKSGLIESYRLVANPHYPLGKPYLSGINFVFYARTEDLASALKSGAIESAYGIPNKSALTAPYSRVFGVFFNSSSNPILARAEVRKALSLAIDRQSIIETALGGYATPVMGPVPPGSGIKETIVPDSQDETADATAILEKAGWQYDGDARVWKHAGAKLALDSMTIKTSNVPELKATASAVKADWEKLGIPTEVELYEPGDLNQNVIRPRKYGALLFGMVIGRDQDLYAFWSSRERTDPGLNIALYANKSVDTLLEDARQTGNPDQRQSDLQKINDLVAADYPAAFTHAPDFVYAVPEELGGVVLPQIATPADRFASVANWYLRTDHVWPFLAK